MPDDTGEFLLGDVLVTLVLMESSQNTSPLNDDSENWTPQSISTTKEKVREGVSWWEETLAGITSRHELNFQFDFTFADAPVSTDYEPISRPSTDFQFWMYDFLKQVGYNHTGNFSTDIRRFNHAQREAFDTDWAFTIFVVNDENDLDGFFAPGGFQKAFGFAGGRFIVVPAGRPASTFAHETGHMFWARDEYPNGGSYNTFRGYYNTQNSNAWDNPAPDFVQVPSIMDTGNCDDGGGRLCTAWLTHTSSESSLQMVGWRDSDGDGVFDLADVPHNLQGYGHYDPESGKYLFEGDAWVSTLPNLNSSGLQNDITTSKISRAEYRIDGGAWQTAQVYDSYHASLSLAISMPADSRQIEIRVVDDITGISSPVFEGTIDHPASTLLPGINGFVWTDSNMNGRWDPDEKPAAAQTVQLIDANGEVLVLQKLLEPDDHTSSGQVLNELLDGVRLSSIGAQVSDGTVTSTPGVTAEGDNRVFASFSANCGGFCSEWTEASRQLRIDFEQPVTTLSIDAIGLEIPGYGRLEVYDTSGNLLARATTGELSRGQTETMTLSRSTAEIAYAIARAHASTTIQLDRLKVGPSATAVTDANGIYAFAYLEPGDFTLAVVTQVGQSVVAPESGVQSVSLGVGAAVGEINFGVTRSASLWQNPNNPFDVNGDSVVSPFDALQIINALNAGGARHLTDEPVPPYLDVNGDGQVTPIDALLIINELNRKVRGEGERDTAASDVQALDQPVSVVAASIPVPTAQDLDQSTATLIVSASAQPLADSGAGSTQATSVDTTPAQLESAVAQAGPATDQPTVSTADTSYETPSTENSGIAEDLLAALATDTAEFWQAQGQP